MALESDHNSPSAVSITKSIYVYPKAFPEPTKVLTLSNLDRQCPTLMYLVFFYKPSDQDSSFDSVFDRLKAGLEATLSICYPAAGRLSLSSPDHDNGKLDLSCNNTGAVLVQAVTRAKISELGDLSVYNEFFENLVFKPVMSDENITAMPLVTAQVTKFDCGGYAIGTGTSHSLFDGISAYEFLRAWGSQCEMYEPVHERGTLLLQKNDHYINEGITNNYSSIPTAIGHLYQLIMQTYSSRPFQNQETSLVFKTFHLSTEMIDNLKTKVLDEKLNDNFSCSTFEVLAAHLWKVRTKALGLERDRKVCLQFAVDARNRMVPPLPKGFSGNAYVLASVFSTAGELEEQSHESTINQIKEAKNSVTHDYVHAYIKALQGPPATLPPLLELTVISDWTRVPFHKIDFIGQDAATYVSPLIPPVPQIAYFMQNPTESRAIDVWIGLLPSIQAAFSDHFMNI
ncbi:hypothetical protein RD792_001790 [Penstemon davidsonii]|uniref:Uncharacterized protein n=1 Tax=Penstemon davidsonii TaxID=160366 RepID=A0ABR0DQH4_9LAMI|nr:hypothetical protein RD792_001790 [Penstemon davidsonii]